METERWSSIYIGPWRIECVLYSPSIHELSIAITDDFESFTPPLKKAKKEKKSKEASKSKKPRSRDLFDSDEPFIVKEDVAPVKTKYVIVYSY